MSGEAPTTLPPVQPRVTSIADLITLLTTTTLTTTQPWYRGQANIAWTLTPKVFREPMYRDSESALLDSFRSEAALSPPTTPLDEWGWIAYAQHHSLPTRLLDWSLDPLVALFFATETGVTTDKLLGAGGEVDGALYVLRPRELNREAGSSALGHPTLLSVSQPIFNGYLPSDPIGNRLSPRAALSPMVFDRIRFQSGRFTVHCPPFQGRADDDFASSNALDKFVIPAESKREVRTQLGVLGITEATIYRDPDRIAKAVARNIEEVHP